MSEVLDLLALAGWSVAEPADTCWLDCPEQGYLLRWWEPLPDGERLVICLCSAHALVLQQGSFRGDYTGAPLPPDSMASEWPWQVIGSVDFEAVAA